MKPPLSIPYNPRWRGIFFAFAFFGGCAGFMGYEATRNTVGLIINGIIKLGPSGGTVFYWVMAGSSSVFVVLSVLMAMRRVLWPKVLEVGTEALLLPDGRFQRKTSRISYPHIERISEVDISGQKFLYVTAGGVRYTITASFLPDDETYNALKGFLFSNVPR